MFKRLRNKFLIMHMGIVALIIFVFLGTQLIIMYNNMERDTDMALNSAMMPPGDMFAVRIIEPGERGERAIRQPRLSPTFTLWLDQDRQIVRIISTFSVDEEFCEQMLAAALADNNTKGSLDYDGAYFKYRLDGSRIIFLDATKEMDMFIGNIYSSLWIAIPTLLLVFLISLLFANRSIKPIEVSYNKQKEFVADASHELKTPLAVIATNADMLLGSADAEQRKWLSYIKTEIERMSSLTESLLYLARMDYTEDNAAPEILDLSKMVADYLLPLEALFYENKINAEVQIIPDIKIKANAEQVRRLIGILADNAVKYNDGNIGITLERTASEAVLTVFNTGKGIEAAEIEHIWDRFYRGDKSRSSAGGFGLGLAIAKSIATRSNGYIMAESQENEWTRFTVRLPLAR